MLCVCWNTLSCSLLSSFCIPFRRHSCINIPAARTPPVKCSALHSILSSGGNLFSASCYNDSSQENVPLWNPTSLLIGGMVCFFECGHCQGKTELLHGPCCEIIREREEREEKHDTALLFWCNFGVALLKELFYWPQYVPCKEDLLVETYTFAWGMLTCLDRYLKRAPEVCDLQFALLHRTPAASSASCCESLLQAASVHGPQLPSSWLFATQPYVECYLP